MIADEIRASGIMLDNWFIEEALSYMLEGITCCSAAYADLLAAIVLWDKVYYPRNANSIWTTWDQCPLADYLIPIEDKEDEGYKEAVEAFHQDPHIFEKEYWRKFVMPGLPNEVIGVGALRYMAVSAKNNCDYLPSSQRQDFLKTYLSQKEFAEMVRYLTAQQFVDASIADYIIEVAQPFISGKEFFIEMPAFARYIIDNTPPEMTPVEYAFHLRTYNAVRHYRDYLQDMSTAAAKNDVLELGYLKSQARNAIAEVFVEVGTGLGSKTAKVLPNFLDILDPIEAVKKGSDLLQKLHESDKKMRLVFLKDLTRHTAKAFQRENS